MNEMSKQIMESVDDQLDSIAAVKGKQFTQFVGMCMTGISLAKVLSSVRTMVSEAEAGNPPPEKVVEGFLGVCLHMVASMTAAASDVASISTEDAKSAMDWAHRITRNAEQSAEVMMKSKE